MKVATLSYESIVQKVRGCKAARVTERVVVVLGWACRDEAAHAGYLHLPLSHFTQMHVVVFIYYNWQQCCMG